MRSPTVELAIERLVVGGDGLARGADGRVVFVAGSLPGERVRAEIDVAKKDFAKAHVVAVIDASPDRVTPPCEAWHRGCGGCDWQHVDPGAQLRHKVGVVTEALTRTARLDAPHVRSGGSVDPWGYRTTIRVARGASGHGFRARRSHDVVPIDTCPIAASGVNEALASLPEGDDEVSIRTSLATGATVRSVDEPAPLTEVVAGVPLQVSIGSFFQSSPRAAELLVAAVGDVLAEAGVELSAAHVVDAYGGIGLFAATVARSAARVTLLEGSPDACADARHNLAGVPAVVVEGSVEHWPPEPADVVIADPARAGLGRAAAEVLARTGAPTFVLVSCDTGSMARDVRLLHELGYLHRVTTVIDAFPNTSHIETVTWLDRAR